MRRDALSNATGCAAFISHELETRTLNRSRKSASPTLYRPLLHVPLGYAPRRSGEWMDESTTGGETQNPHLQGACFGTLLEVIERCNADDRDVNADSVQVARRRIRKHAPDTLSICTRSPMRRFRGTSDSQGTLASAPLAVSVGAYVRPSAARGRPGDVSSSSTQRQHEQRGSRIREAPLAGGPLCAHVDRACADCVDMQG